MSRLMRLACVVFLVPSLGFGNSGGAVVAYGFVAHEKDSNLVKGTTVFNESEVETYAQGHAAIFLTGTPAKLHVLPDSRVKVSGSKDAPFVDLEKGGIGFVGDVGTKLRVRAAGAVIRPGSGQGMKGEVKLLGPGRLYVAAFTEPIAVEADTETVVVPTGSVYTLLISTQERENPAGVGRPQALRRRTILILGSAMLLAVIGIGIWLNNRGGGQPGTVVSPVIP